MKVKYKAGYNLAKAHKSDSGYDVRTIDRVIIFEGKTMLISTGLFLELPKGLEAQVRPKSSLSSKGLLVHFGTVDQGYRGEVKVAITNLTGQMVALDKGQKIAQLVFAPLVDVDTVMVDEIKDDTDRGQRGFGSTGKF